MKNLKFIIALVYALMLSFVAVFAGVEQDDVTVMPIHNTSKFYVSFAENVTAQQVKIRIKTKDGNLIYADQIFTNKVTKVYDMVEYSKGQFLVEIIGKDFQFTKSVEVGKLAGFDAKIIQENDRIELVYLSRDTDLDIYLKDEQGNILYYGSGNIGKCRKAFDVTQLPAGNYTLKVTNGEQVFVEMFEINR